MIELSKTVVLVGLMGAGKSAIGRRLAEELSVTFVDSDEEIEREQDCSISEIFTRRGEPEFRKFEREYIKKDLKFPPHVLATGGGAFIQEETRELILSRAVSVWLKAELDVLLERVSRKNTRPLLEQGDKRATLERLMKERYPIYAKADIVIQTDESPHQEVVQEIIRSLKERKHA